MTQFSPGLQLNADFYSDVVAPLARPFGHSAALLGWGSDVLGYDTQRSTDHGWGPRMQVFVAAADVDAARATIDAGLPDGYAGWPVRYGWDSHEIAHRVTVVDLGSWLRDHLGLDPRAGLDVADWLTLPQQLLLGMVEGAVYADTDGALYTVREQLAYFPEQVWRWMLASQWQRLGQEEHFHGRAAEVGDDLGSRLIAGRLVRELMRLAFLIERTYWPYSKWFGTAFQRLDVAARIQDSLTAAVTAAHFPDREAALVDAFETLARRYNSLDLHRPLDTRARQFHSRPFRVLGSERFAHVGRDSISDAGVRSLPLIGSIDQFVDSTDVLTAEHAHRLRGLLVPET